MTNHNNLRPLPIFAIAVLLGLAACKPSVPAASDAAAPPSMDTGNDSAKASASEKVAAAVDAINPLTSAREAVIASMHKMMEARSYHMSMQTSSGTKRIMGSEVDFVAPDRFRMVMDGVGTQTIVGDTMYMSMQGRNMKVPMPKDTTNQWRDPGNFKEAEAGMTAEAMGNESVDGISTKKYTVRQSVPTTSEYTLWIGSDGMPLQMRLNTNINGAAATMTMRYSRINDPTLAIEVPK